MDRHTAFVGSYDGERYVCIDCERCAVGTQCPDCAEYVMLLVPQLSELEREVETLRAVLAKKDEALQYVLSETSVTFEDERLKYVDAQMSRGVLDRVRAALHLTPSSATEEAEDARIGRAIRSGDWLGNLNLESLMPRMRPGYAQCLKDLQAVIEQAKAGDPHA